MHTTIWAVITAIWMFLLAFDIYDYCTNKQLYEAVDDEYDVGMKYKVEQTIIAKIMIITLCIDKLVRVVNG